jgi:hypothetical protein
VPGIALRKVAALFTVKAHHRFTDL